MKYSEKVIEHFTNPRNVGVIEDADGVGKVGNPVCGDMMEMSIKVEDDLITDVKKKLPGTRIGQAIPIIGRIPICVKRRDFWVDARD